MSPTAAKTFTAVLEPDRTRLRWVIARVPFDPAEAWPNRRGLRVRVTIGEHDFRTSLFAFTGGEGHYLLVNRQMQAAADAAVGSRVRIRLEPDLEERAAETPPELTHALKEDRRLPKWFAGLSHSCRREIGGWIAEPKSTELRMKRAEQMAERLLLTLEGETETPPILEAAFRRQPLARKGWQAMTPVQRRGHLLGIFYYQSVESREKRAEKAVDEALRVARKVSN